MIQKIKRTLENGLSVRGIRETLDIAIEVLNIIFLETKPGVIDRLDKALIKIKRKGSKTRSGNSTRAHKPKATSHSKILIKNVLKRSMLCISQTTLKLVKKAIKIGTIVITALSDKLMDFSHSLKFNMMNNWLELKNDGKDCFDHLQQDKHTEPYFTTFKTAFYSPISYFQDTVDKNNKSIKQVLAHNYQLFESFSEQNNRLITNLYNRKLIQWHLYITGLHCRLYYTKTSFIDLSFIFKLIASFFNNDEEEYSYSEDSIKAMDSYCLGTSCHSFLSSS